jgi:hypothetical protein
MLDIINIKNKVDSDEAKKQKAKSSMKRGRRR